MTLTRPRKARILERAGLRYIAAWLPAETADSLTEALAEGEKIASAALEGIERENRDE